MSKGRDSEEIPTELLNTARRGGIAMLESYDIPPDVIARVAAFLDEEKQHCAPVTPISPIHSTPDSAISTPHAEVVNPDILDADPAADSAATPTEARPAPEAIGACSCCVIS